MFEWFPKSTAADRRRLERWRGADSNYEPNQPVDSRWQIDSYERVLGPEVDNLFDRAVDQLMRYRLFPPEIASITSDFGLQNRRLRPRDYLVQRSHLVPRLLDMIGMYTISNVIYEANRIGFTRITSIRHVEMGEWTAVVDRREAGSVHLLVHSVSKAAPKIPFWARTAGRTSQIRADQAMLKYFGTSLVDNVGPTSEACQ